MAVSMTPAGAAFPGINGKIACASNRTGDFELFTFEPSPAWHPDGSQIVYQRNIPGVFFEVYKVNIDGTG